jgi:hypothetical protein
MTIYIRLFALFNVANGLVMIIDPMTWYLLTPGAAETGPFNVHFVRDIGIAFVAAGAGLWLAVGDSAWKPASTPIVAMIFIGGHGILHFVEMFAHHLELTAALRDLALIVVPAAIAGWWAVREVQRSRRPAEEET